MNKEIDIKNYLDKQKEELKKDVNSLKNGGELSFAFLSPRQGHWKKAFNKVLDICHESISIRIDDNKLNVNQVIANEVFSCEYELNDIYLDVVNKISDFFIEYFSFVPKLIKGYPFKMEYKGNSFEKYCELLYDDYLNPLLSYLSFISPKPLSFMYNYPNVPVSIDNLNLEYITLPDLYSHMYFVKAFADDNISFYEMAKNLYDDYKINKGDFVGNKNIKGIRLRKEPSEIFDPTFFESFKDCILKTEDVPVNVSPLKYDVQKPSEKEKELLSNFSDDSELPF